MAKKGRVEFEEQPWYRDVADLMVREGLNFSVACQSLGIKFATAKEEASHERRKSFKRIFWSVRNKHYSEIGSDPSLTKEVAMGVLARNLVKLEEKGDFDKIATCAKTLSDIAGWTKDSTGVTILGSLSQADLDAIKLKARALVANPTDSSKDEVN